MRHVFISYTTKDLTVAEQLCAVLERNGLKCWIAPRDSAPGFAWAESIATAINESELMIAVVSEDACRSKDMAHELEGAERNKVPILPIRLDGTPLTGQFGYFLGNKQWLDLGDRSPKDYESRVVPAVRILLARSNGPEAAGERVLVQQGPTAREPRSAIHTIADEMRNVIKTFVAAVMKREKALADHDLSDSRTLFFAFRFLIYMSVASAILHIPAWSAQGIHFGHPAFLPLAVADELIEQTAFCFLLYAAIRLFGGTADPQQFFSAFGLLSAYLLISSVCLVPVHVPAIAARNPDIEKLIQGAAAMGDRISVGDLAVLLIAMPAWIALRIVFVLSLFRAFHITNQLGATRTAMSFVVGIGMWYLGVLVFSPFLANLYGVFRGR